MGIREVLNGSASFDDVVWTDPDTNFKFVPNVVRSRTAHTNEILSSDEMKRFVEAVRNRFDQVIVDLSPLAPVVDVRATTHFIDSYLFVVEWGKTKIAAVEHAFGDARGVYENLLGVVLNKANIGVLSRYEGFRGNYYYNRYYTRYGYGD